MKVIVLLLVTCKLCWTIRVPVVWDEGESDESQNSENNEKFSLESFKPKDSSERTIKPHGDSSAERSKPGSSKVYGYDDAQKPIPVEYFEYTAKKPQFAVDVAAFHGVQSPENHYKAYPIRPYTGRVKPELGKHRILDSSNTLHRPFQDYTKINDDVSHADPVTLGYEVFHPYKAETPALQEIYKDPILNKIRNDLENSKNRLQQYEKDAGEPNISKDEYLESPQKTDGKLFPQRHRPASFEIHRPQRRPVYYRPGLVYKNREQYLNQKLRHPWNHNIAKVRPIHYRPIQKHIYQLRQNQALKYDDERNEYPQVQTLENYSDPKDGYDIYESGKDKYVHLRNNVDESINNAVKQNRPASYEKLEAQNNDSASDNDDDNGEEEFIPIQSYAQVRKTETFKHLPRSAALDDAETYDEIKNAPRLREAVKSTKAQTVYSEEGYEDAAYDHAGEQKHASENEGHGGFLKENELSGGKYKTPSVSASYEDGKGSAHRDQLIHAEKWKDDNKGSKEEVDGEDYTEDEHEYLLEVDNHQTEPQNEDNDRHKRENKAKNETMSSYDISSNVTQDKDVQHEVDKREANFEVPEINLNSTFFKDGEFLKIAKLKVVPKKDNIKKKYPYYFKNLKTINRDSPLRYAENLKFIPKKSNGGTEFYDSRSKFECPEVDDVPDPVPEKLKVEGNPDEENDSSEKQSSGDENYDTRKKQPRLKGLGDKIDCFKAKYFGENPLDSPFFKEDIINSPEPVFLPKIAAFKQNAPFLLKQKGENAAKPIFHILEKLAENNTSDLFDLIKKLRNDQNVLQSSLAESNKDFVSSIDAQNIVSNLTKNSYQLAEQSSVYDDVIENIKTSQLNVTPQSDLHNNSDTSNILIQSKPDRNITYIHFQSKEDVTKPPLTRKKRATLFVYEPYKIIRDGQIQDDSKKSSVTSNMSPLIKQLQSSKVIDTVIKLSPKDTQHVKRNVNTRPYKDIGIKDREIKINYGASKNDKSYENSDIIDVSIDKRRGEPRYEINHGNHKSKYTPVTNTKSMTTKDYETQIANSKQSTNKNTEKSIVLPVRKRRPTEKSYSNANVQRSTTPNIASETVSTTLKPSPYNYDESEEFDEDSESEEDYEEYDEDQQGDKEENIKTSTTSTTSKPALQHNARLLLTTSTQKPLGFIEGPRLKLVTRFRDYKPHNYHEKEHDLSQNKEHYTKKDTQKTATVLDENIEPKFREKKKKLTKSTLVTDTKRYGDAVDGDDKTMKEEVDALIGIKRDMNDYELPYEKNEERKSKENTSEEGDSNEDGDDDYDDDFDEDEDDSDENVDYEDVDKGEDDDGEIENKKDNDGDIEIEPKSTTPEPTKRTLVMTTDAPLPTIASRSAKLQVKPIITKKKIEIHNELPVNKSSPHITQFKQDIQEIEIIKETRNPLRRKPNKNVEVLKLYNDENLAKDINMLGVEIFKENLDLRQGPKHGGNYRSADPSTTLATQKISKQSKDDAEASQSEYKKHIELDDNTSNVGDSKFFQGRKFRNRSRNLKSTELSDNLNTAMHGGNLKYGGSRNNNAKSQKLIELDDDDDSLNDSLDEKSYDSSRKPMHGGNYRSAQLKQKKERTSTESTRPRSKDARQNAAFVLSSFVQAAPVLSTKAAIILDPSKRKYYYVDA